MITTLVYYDVLWPYYVHIHHSSMVPVIMAYYAISHFCRLEADQLTLVIKPYVSVTVVSMCYSSLVLDVDILLPQYIEPVLKLMSSNLVL